MGKDQHRLRRPRYRDFFIADVAVQNKKEAYVLIVVIDCRNLSHAITIGFAVPWIDYPALEMFQIFSVLPFLFAYQFDLAFFYC